MIVHPAGHVTLDGAPFHAMNATITSPDAVPAGSVTTCEVVDELRLAAAAMKAIATGG